MFVRTYKHYKIDNPILWGLSLITILKISLASGILLVLAQNLSLKINGPIFLILAIATMVIICFIIKAAQGEEIKGYYKSFLWHPFQNHIFPLWGSKEGHKSLASLIDIATIEHAYLISKKQDLISIIALEGGVSLFKYDPDEQLELMNNWGNLLSQINSISNLDSYFFGEQSNKDCLQIFIKSKPFQAATLGAYMGSNPNLDKAHKINSTWYSQFHNPKKFIQDLDFYLILRQSNQQQNSLLHTILDKLNLKIKSISKISEEELASQKILLKEKIKSIKLFFQKYSINCKELRDEELKNFTQEWIPKEYFENQDSCTQLIDKAKYISYQNTIYKTYRLKILPDSGNLNFWLLDYCKRLKITSYLSLILSKRNAHKDLKNAEQKAKLIRDFNKNKERSNDIMIRENLDLAEELLNKPYCFDLSLFITIATNDLKILQDFDNQMKMPQSGSVMDGAERQQVNNFIYSWPFAFENLSDKEKHFANFDLAKASFPIFKSQLGSDSGIFIGTEVDNMRPIYLNDYDRSIFNNRGINFIGDSGSGKTVTAKLLVKRAMLDPERRFFIIDNTADGWNFFVNYCGGKVIIIDKPQVNYQESLFAPLVYKSNQDLNQHIEEVIRLLSIMANKEKNLSQGEKKYLSKILKKLYSSRFEACLSDLYNLINSFDHDIYQEFWLDALGPYCYAGGGIYASLADSIISQINTENIILFTFAKLHNDPNYLPTSLHLINNFISKKILEEKTQKITLIVDEAWRLLNNKSHIESQQLFTYFARAGRGLDLGLWTISQKPSDLPAEIHSSASCSFCFQLKELNDKNDMGRYAGLKQNERILLDDYSMFDSGTALFKTTRASGLISITMDTLEEFLTNSTRNFSDKRHSIFANLIQKGLNQQEAAFTTFKILTQYEDN